MKKPGQQPVIAILIHENGYWEPVYDIHWKNIQQMVGGYHQLFTIASFDDADVFVADCGLLEGLPLNFGAFMLWGATLAGKVLVTGGPDHEGNTMPITPAMTRRIVYSLIADERHIEDLVFDPMVGQAISDMVRGVPA